MTDKVKHKSKHIKLTSHPGSGVRQADPDPLGCGRSEDARAGHRDAHQPRQRNVIGTHSGSYGVYRALAVAAKALDPRHVPI